MKKQDLAEADNATDIAHAVDIALFQAALAVQHIALLIAHGGHPAQRPDLDDAQRPEQITAFIGRALIHAGQTGHFEPAWKQLQEYMPLVQVAWERGRAAFHSDLTRAERDTEEMGYLTMVDFASGSYARANAYQMYQKSATLQEWVVNGYMGAWREHFLKDKK